MRCCCCCCFCCCCCCCRCYIIPHVFFTPALADGFFFWSLSDSKSPRVSRTLLIIIPLREILVPAYSIFQPSQILVSYNFPRQSLQFFMTLLSRLVDISCVSGGYQFFHRIPIFAVSFTSFFGIDNFYCLHFPLLFQPSSNVQVLIRCFAIIVSVWHVCDNITYSILKGTPSFPSIFGQPNLCVYMCTVICTISKHRSNTKMFSVFQWLKLIRRNHEIFPFCRCFFLWGN